MEIVRIPRILQDSIKKQRMHGKTVGFVPTMGALHEGHMSIMRACRLENDLSVASIFVNPLQFGPSEDFQKYPRDIEADVEKLKKADVDVLFLPDASSMFPEGFETSVSVIGLSSKLCGKFRPGHFSGVATVVAKLFNIVSPVRAYFGQKDYQQGLIIKKLVKDLNMDIEIITHPTQREPDGLVMSSRNQYLNPEQRKAAKAIYKSLVTASERIKSGLRDVKDIEGLMKTILNAEPLITEIQYASAYDMETLNELTEIKKTALLAVAVKLGDIRLIDNLGATSPC